MTFKLGFPAIFSFFKIKGIKNRALLHEFTLEFVLLKLTFNQKLFKLALLRFFMVYTNEKGASARVWNHRSPACLTVECAYNLLMQERILPRDLRNPKTFEAYVSQVYGVEKRFGMPSIDFDSYLRMHRKFDPNREENGRRSLQSWPGPKVAQGEFRENQRPRVDRRNVLTTGWEILSLSDYANNHKILCQTRKPSESQQQAVKPAKIYRYGDRLDRRSMFEHLECFRYQPARKVA
jgi:hypothetical protein